MCQPNCFNQPKTLITGIQYSLMSENWITDEKEVTFFSYTSNPEIVIVQLQSGKIVPIARSTLYEKNGEANSVDSRNDYEKI